MKWQDVVAIVSLVVTIGGFAVAITQIRRGIRASEAAERAATTTADRIAANQLLGLVPQLQLLESELGACTQSNDHDGATRILLKWRHVSSQARGILLRGSTDQAGVLEQLQRAAALTTTAKESLIDRTKPVSESTKRVSRAISQAVDEISALGGRLALEPGEGATNE